MFWVMWQDKKSLLMSHVPSMVFREIFARPQVFKAGRMDDDFLVLSHCMILRRMPDAECAVSQDDQRRNRAT